jgi:glycine dehydrogenase subunit 1
MTIFEFQTWISELSGLPLANASLYDGATALAEAVLMGLRVRKRAERVYLAEGIAPNVRSVVERYLGGQDVEVVLLPRTDDGRTDLSPLVDDDELKVVAIGSPNGYGVLETPARVREVLGEKDFLVVHATDPHVWLLLDPPGAQGADVAVAEGQPFGVPPNFGGPLLGLFAAGKAYMRQMPGRLAGETVDRDGRTGYVLTLSTREQHIRREKATSNICSNQGVIALLATVTMAVLGPTGLRRRALESAANARRLESLLRRHGFSRRYDAPFFNEFAVDHPRAAEIWANLVGTHEVQLGMPLVRWDAEDDTGLLVCATAGNHDAQFETLSRALQEVAPA